MAFNARHAKATYFKSFDFYVFITSMLFDTHYRDAFETDYLKTGRNSLLQRVIFPLYNFKNLQDYHKQVGSFLDNLKPGKSESVTPAMQFLKNCILSCKAIENTLKILKSLPKRVLYSSLKTHTTCHNS